MNFLTCPKREGFPDGNQGREGEHSRGGAPEGQGCPRGCAASEPRVFVSRRRGVLSFYGLFSNGPRFFEIIQRYAEMSKMALLRSSATQKPLSKIWSGIGILWHTTVYFGEQVIEAKRILDLKIRRRYSRIRVSGKHLKI